MEHDNAPTMFDPGDRVSFIMPVVPGRTRIKRGGYLSDTIFYGEVISETLTANPACDVVEIVYAVLVTQFDLMGERCRTYFEFIEEEIPAADMNLDTERGN